MLASYAWAMAARVQGAWCWVRGHRLDWSVGAEDDCAGDIVCHTCELVVWCRYYDPWRRRS